MARFYANENFPRQAVLALRRFGHDVLTIQETGRAGLATPDRTVLDFATKDGRAVLTHNRKHFLRLHRKSPHHAGIVACRTDVDFQGLAERIHEAAATFPSLAGRLIRINRPKPA